MYLASICGFATNIETWKARAGANRFQTGFDLLFYISKDREYLVRANIGCAVSGCFFCGPVTRYDVTEQVCGYQTASHAFDDSVVKKTAIVEVPGRACQLNLTATKSFGKLA